MLSLELGQQIQQQDQAWQIQDVAEPFRKELTLLELQLLLVATLVDVFLRRLEARSSCGSTRYLYHRTSALRALALNEWVCEQQRDEQVAMELLELLELSAASELVDALVPLAHGALELVLASAQSVEPEQPAVLALEAVSQLESMQELHVAPELIDALELEQEVLSQSQGALEPEVLSRSQGAPEPGAVSQSQHAQVLVAALVLQVAEEPTRRVVLEREKREGLGLASQLVCDAQFLQELACDAQ